MAEEGSRGYLSSVVGRVNRHRLIAVFVATPMALAVLYLFGRGPIDARDILQTTLFAVGTYSSGAAAVSSWPTRKKQALAGPTPPPPVQVWLFRALSFLCAVLSLIALFGVWITIHNA